MRIFKALKNIYLTKTPTYVIFFVTSFCNARCKMCFNWRRIEGLRPEDELGLDEIKKIFDTFSGIQQLTISGGEPFLRDDLPEILGFISHKNNVQMITLPSNGIVSDKIFDMTQNILKKIKKDTHLRIGLSIEGIGKRHDEIVQVEGAFGQVEKTYRMLLPLTRSYRNFNIDIAICISGFNKNELKNTIKYCNENFTGCTIELIMARGDTKESFSKSVSEEEYREVLDYLYQLKGAKKINKPFAKIFNVLAKIVNRQVLQIMSIKKMPSRCYAYSKMIVLQSNGEVYPCEYLDRKLGNLRGYEYNIKKMLNDKGNKEIEKFIKNGNCFCTWECALINNIVCNPRTYPKVFKEVIKATLSQGAPIS